MKSKNASSFAISANDAINPSPMLSKKKGIETGKRLFLSDPLISSLYLEPRNSLAHKLKAVYCHH